MAIITRWRCRPRADAGTRRRSSPAPGMPTRRKSSTARARASRRDFFRWMRIPLGDLPADRVDGVQAGHRLLEDHRHDVAAHVAHRPLGQREEVSCPRARPRRTRFARAGTRRDGGSRARSRSCRTHSRRPARPWSPRDVERHSVDGANDALIGAKGRHQIADAEERRVVHAERQAIAPMLRSSRWVDASRIAPGGRHREALRLPSLPRSAFACSRLLAGGADVHGRRGTAEAQSSCVAGRCVAPARPFPPSRRRGACSTTPSRSATCGVEGTPELPAVRRSGGATERSPSCASPSLCRRKPAWSRRTCCSIGSRRSTPTPSPSRCTSARVVDPWDGRSLSWAVQPRVEEVGSPVTRVLPASGPLVRIDVRVDRRALATPEQARLRARDRLRCSPSGEGPVAVAAASGSRLRWRRAATLESGRRADGAPGRAAARSRVAVPP